MTHSITLSPLSSCPLCRSSSPHLSSSFVGQARSPHSPLLWNRLSSWGLLLLYLRNGGASPEGMCTPRLCITNSALVTHNTTPRFTRRYDPAFQAWGMENVELSVKTWTCGTGVAFHPCSHVGRYLRLNRDETDTRYKDESFMRANTIRFAEVMLSPFLLFSLSFCNLVQFLLATSSEHN